MNDTKLDRDVAETIESEWRTRAAGIPFVTHGSTAPLSRRAQLAPMVNEAAADAAAARYAELERERARRGWRNVLLIAAAFVAAFAAATWLIFGR